ncbi:hypothetical protein MGA5115_02224 [Marinomonas gallaica]|uniref:Fe2OG dioxygenase domain-containing protein n=1 Tax=Marinomonas gallaica TaxID=1806667 RepID=A0A1C3JSM9_9GAMM|nr:alpha-ketoglutarate-dependent dioxygenase AlkB [Marinomonas gallaica]SBT18105.1 hypothetical protein MGA5115_02224 [Marinomonas gallaica]SBT22485.1 hypothetical protein MGA5116_03106 [Marinomonas gallaica]
MDDLFSQIESKPLSLLPYDGDVTYCGHLIPPEQSRIYFNRLLNEVDWQYDQAIIFGKHIITKRKVAWYAEHAFQYTYSKTTKTAKLWTPLLLELKQLVEQQTKEQFNSCLLNLYHDGSEGMSWHSDAERELVEQGVIASLSFGAKRKFSFKHKDTKETHSVELDSGSLLVMKGATQRHWLHSLPTTKKVDTPRINLTFRQIRTE